MGNNWLEPLIPVNMANQSNKDPEQNKKRDEETNPEAELNDQDPGERQKRNQGDQKDDPLAA
ncbi:MAG TPA: hypothetical protein VF786_05565 [Terriglobales bacterium]